MALDLETLKAERERLKQELKEIEGEHRKAEGQLKQLRQGEIKAKREIEALTTLIEMQTGATAPDEG